MHIIFSILLPDVDLGKAQPEGSELVGQYVGAKFLIPARWEEEATELSPAVKKPSGR